jgi:hypothetical protein
MSAPPLAPDIVDAYSTALAAWVDLMARTRRGETVSSLEIERVLRTVNLANAGILGIRVIDDSSQPEA